MHVVLFCMCGFVSVRVICSALPLSFMGCVGLLCFVLFFLLYMLFLFWRVVFVFVLVCIVQCRCALFGSMLFGFVLFRLVVCSWSP